jgi:metallo-beta-lactamase family protein
MKLSFFGAVGGVTGSCYMVTCGMKKFLVDCGMFQGCKAQKEFNYKDFPFAPAEIDFVVLTHAHIDHTGLLPKLVKHGFKGPIFASDPTAEVLKHILPDSARIQESEVLQKNRRLERKGQEPISPIYSIEDADEAVGRLRGSPINAAISPAEGIHVRFHNAGHVFGSSFLEITLAEAGVTKKVVFSGDLGGPGHPIVKDPDTFTDADILLIETTYGNRVHTDTDTEKRLQKLAEVVQSTLKAGGNLIIPAFAFERTQDLMHDLTILMDRQLIPEVEVVVDSPLAIHATQVFTKFPQYYDEQATALLKKHGNLFDHERFKFTLSADESRELNKARKTIIISSSGMCDAGRIKHHLKHNLWRPESTVLFVGYQAEGTLGRLLLEGAETVRIHGEEIKVEARIDRIPGYSGHADQNELIQWLAPVKAIRDKVFLVHGEDDARKGFAELLKTKFSYQVAIPLLGEVYDILTVKSDTSTATELPPVDSYNLYAHLMLKLASFMRSTNNEAQRRTLIEQIIKTIPN